jgi:ATP-dependent Clp protease protease subunit
MLDTLMTPKKRILYLTKDVDAASMGELTKDIIEINDNDVFLKKLYNIHSAEYIPQPIQIFIDSYGGLVYQCFGLLSIINNSKTPIYTIVTGCAMSCGFMILISGHKRFSYELSTPLYHQISSGMFGKLKNIEDELREAKRLQDLMEKIVLSRTKITKKKLEEIYNMKTDWYMSSSEALKFGVIDEIIKND